MIHAQSSSMFRYALKWFSLYLLVAIGGASILVVGHFLVALWTNWPATGVYSLLLGVCLISAGATYSYERIKSMTTSSLNIVVLPVPADTYSFYYNALDNRIWAVVPRTDPKGQPLSYSNHEARLLEVRSNHGLILHGITKRFADGFTIEGIRLCVRAGEIVCIIGGPRAGKTKLLHLVAGSEVPDSGRIYWNQAELATVPPYFRARMGIGYVGSEPSLYSGMNVEENVRTSAELIAPDLASVNALESDIITLLALDSLRRVAATKLRPSDRRRVEIARALALKPSLLLVDDPFLETDPMSAAYVKDAMLKAREWGMGILLAGNNLHEMLAISDRLYILHCGQIIMEAYRRHRAGGSGAASSGFIKAA